MASFSFAQRISIPDHLPAAHPRVSARPGSSLPEVAARFHDDPAAQTELARAKTELAPYLAHTATDPMWLASRLQMYWKSHASEVYNRGGVFDHVAGQAPVATVRYPGSRDPLTVYKAPTLDQIPPYEDDTRGVLLVNGSLPDQPLEWVDPARSGRAIDGINSRILHLAATAAKLYWITGDEQYAHLAIPVLDTYLRGMYYRKVPIDITHGHSETIYGLSTFEVIQEGILRDIADSYDYLYAYIHQHDPSALPIYVDAMRRWIDVTITNGVPFNNWDLIEARFVAAVALVLDGDEAYADHRGEQYYLNAILNDSVTRQWSLSKLAARGFDPHSAIWFESPGYSMNVVRDFITLVNDLDAALGTDLLFSLPILQDAVLATGQYLYPNGYTISFGDGHHVLLSSGAAREMVENAQRHRRPEQERRFTAMAKFLEANAIQAGHPEATEQSRGLDAIITPRTLVLDPSVPPATLADLVSPTFSAPSVSYFVQRNGPTPEDGLMAAESGSLGNHQHATGINLELYGRGLVLAPESGIGSNYFESDHAEYYSQFPASNTVAVDGISSYPTMKSHHGFALIAAYPTPSKPSPAASPAITFSDVYFHEPETDADQRRLVSIIRTSPTSGYYLDIFRSRRRDGHDLMHDYFFHGIGQSMNMDDDKLRPLPLKPTEELTFANEELPAYDYFWDKRSTSFAGDTHIRFNLSLPNREAQMNLWFAGSQDRELFSVKAPASHAVNEFLPKQIAELPMPTFIARQHGEAWSHPFIAIFEPTDSTHPTALKSITRFTAAAAPKDFVGLDVVTTDGTHQQIFSAADPSGEIAHQGITFNGTFAVVTESHSTHTLFLGKGSLLARDGIRLNFPDQNASADLQYGSSAWTLTTSESALLTVVLDRLSAGQALLLTDSTISPRRIQGKASSFEGKIAITYELPPLHEAQLTWRR